MRKLFSLIAAVLFAGSMMAVDFTLSSNAEVTQDGITVTFAKGEGSNNPAWYEKGLRLYAKNEVTVSSSTPIASITFNWEKQGTKAFASASASTGSYTHPSEAGEGKWTGSATSVTFTLGASGQLQLNTFSVTLEAGGGEEPPVSATAADTLQGYINDLTLIRDFILSYAPTADVSDINTALTTANQALDSGNELTIRYMNTLAEGYKTQFINEALTQGKAAVVAGFAELAQEGDDATCQQLIADAQAVINNAAWDDTKSVEANLAALKKLGEDTYAKLQADLEAARNPGAKNTCASVIGMANDAAVSLNDVVVTYVNGKNVWVKDATGPMLLYLTANATWKAGDVLSGVEGSVFLYNNAVYEVKMTADQVSAVSATAGTAPEPEEITAAMTNADINKYALLKDITFSASFTEGSATNITIQVYGADVVIRNYFKNGYTFDASKKYDVTVVVSYYNSKLQLYFISAAEAGQGGGGEEPPVVLPDPTNCAEAAQAALSVSANNVPYKDSTIYTITGYVTAIQTAYNSGYNNISFWMADTKEGGKVLEAYRCIPESAEEVPAVGDKVAVTGALSKYNKNAQFMEGCTCKILEKDAPAVNLGEKTIAEFLELKNIKDTCILTGVVDSIQNNLYGNLYLSDETGEVYVYGVLTADGQKGKFAELNVEKGDTLTIKAIYGEYNNAPQISNAIFVEVKKATAVTPVEPEAWDFVKSEYLVYDADGYFDLMLYTSDGWSYDYSEGWTVDVAGAGLVLDMSYTDMNNLVGTYSSEDLSLDCSGSYTYVATWDGESANLNGVYFTSGTVTVEFNDDQSAYIVNYTLYDANNTKYEGTATAALYEEEAPIEPTDYVDINISENIEYYEQTVSQDFYYWYIEAADTEHYIILSNLDPLLATDGEYPYTKLDPDYSYILTATDSIWFVGGSITVETDQQGNVSVTGQLVGSDAIGYNITLLYTAQAPETPDGYYLVGNMTNWGVDATNKLQANASAEGEWMITLDLAAGDEFKIVYSADGSAETTWYPGGTNNNYTIAEDATYDVYFRPEGNVDDWYYGYFYVTKHEYPTVDLTISAITAPGSVSFVDAVEQEGWWGISAWNDDYYISIYTPEGAVTALEGTYSIDKLDGQYSLIYAGESMYGFTSGSVTVALNEDVLSVSGQLVAEDGTIYNVNLIYVEPKAENTVNVTISNGSLEADFSEDEEGMVSISGEDENGVFVVLYIYTEQIAGTYSEYDLDMYSGIMVGQESADIYTAEITVTPGNGNGDYNVTANILCYNNTQYNVTMYIPANPETGIEETIAAGKAAKVLRNGQILILKGDKVYNLNGAVIR